MPGPRKQEGASERIDVWLWAARLCRSRGLAAAMARAGRIRVNGGAVRKAGHRLKPEDVLTFVKGERVMVVRVRSFSPSRGAACEAGLLYEDISPPVLAKDADPPPALRDRGSGRPTKAERRALDRLRAPE